MSLLEHDITKNRQVDKKVKAMDFDADNVNIGSRK